MDYTTSHFTWSFWDTFRIPTNQVSPSQTLRCPGACDSRHEGHVVIFGPITGLANQYWYLPVPTYGSTWVVLWLLFCRSAPSTFPVTWSTLKSPFRGVPSHRLYSEIDHIHLSSEAQYVSHHLPLVDCHIPYWIYRIFYSRPKTGMIYHCRVALFLGYKILRKTLRKKGTKTVPLDTIAINSTPFSNYGQGKSTPRCTGSVPLQKIECNRGYGYKVDWFRGHFQQHSILKNTKWRGFCL